MTARPARSAPSSFVRVFGTALLALLAPQAALGQPSPAPATSSEIVVRAADIAFTRYLDRARAKRTLDDDRRKVAMVRRAATLLIAYAPSFEPKTTGWRWTIHLETRDDPMAFCLPGGSIMLSTGLIDRTRLTADELPVVIAHVMAHAMSGHEADLALRRLAAMPEAPDPNRRLLQLADLLLDAAQSAPHARDVERETDALALELMARAGVDPRSAPEAWRKIARAGGATPPGFLALHATWPGRIEEIEKALLPLLPLYEQAQAVFASRPRAPPVRPRSGVD
jgi:Zn-dependent protease with chaperone function